MISLIVAASRNQVIGRQGKLPWDMPADLAHFKQLTMGHPIIMGRKTYESIGRGLPGRTNIVVTSNPDYHAKDCEVADSLDSALKIAERSPGSDEILIIGGQRLFEEALSKADHIHLTRIKADIDGDTFFEFDQRPWQTVTCEKHPADEHNPYPYNFAEMVRKTS